MKDNKLQKLRESNRAKYILGMSLNLIFIAIEISIGLFANSLGLISDALHNLSDVFSFALAFIASILSTRKPTSQHTYGLRATSILAAFINAVLLPLAMLFLIYQAAMRLINGQADVNGGMMIWVAGIGVLIGGFTAWLFSGQNDKDLNQHANYMHFIADTLVSIAVLLAGVAISFTGWNWLDPVVTILAAGYVLIKSIPLIIDTWNLIIAGVPKNVDEPSVKNYLLSLSGVTKINDLHIWAMSTTENAMTCHLQCDQSTKNTKIIDKITDDMRKKFNIDHVTVQLEEKTYKHKELDV